MQRRSLVRAARHAVAGLGLRLALPWFRVAVPARAAGMMDQGDMQGMMAPENREAMRTGMALFAAHADVRRVVTDLPDGVHAVTTSADPKTAALIQAHVTEMYARLGSGNAFPYPMSPSVPVMFENSTLYQRNLTALPDGIDVTETSTDPAMIKIIQSHAREITGFVREGMPAMMRGMMR
jgi:hypothetical protein